MSTRSPRPHKHETLDVTVTGLAFGGKGVARVDDFVVFVSGAVPGDVARVRITKIKKRYAEGRVEDLVLPSPDRVAPRCPSFGVCGGCTWQDLEYRVQLDYKARQVRESLEHLGGLFGFELRPIISMADPWRYRNRADFAIGNGVDGAVIGFRPPGRWDTVSEVSECHLLSRSMEEVRGTVEHWLREARLPGWDPCTHAGFARHLLVRSARSGAEVLVSLVTVPERLPDAAGLVERLRAAHPEVVGIVHAVNGGSAELSAGLESTTLWGRPYLLEQVAGLTLKISLDAFFQTNTLMAHVLYGLAAREAGIGGGDAGVAPGSAVGPDVGAADGGPTARRPVVWDLYSGVGSIGLSLARGAAGVLGIEAVPSAVRDAEENARLNGIADTRFVEGDVRRVLREVAQGSRTLPRGLEKPDVILVDPPRAGLHRRVVDRIGETGAPRIVYVSCNPSTMAPNVSQLQGYGYRLERVTPVDMFPHTPHVECVGLLTLSTAAGPGTSLPGS